MTDTATAALKSGQRSFLADIFASFDDTHYYKTYCLMGESLDLRIWAKCSRRKVELEPDLL
jgi:hypothetical protein